MTQHEHRSKFKTRRRCNKPHDSYGNRFEKKASLSTKSQLETRKQINVIAGLLKLRETIFCFRQFKISWTQNQYNLLFNVKRHMSSWCLSFESYIKYDICLRLFEECCTPWLYSDSQKLRSQKESEARTEIKVRTYTANARCTFKSEESALKAYLCDTFKDLRTQVNKWRQRANWFLDHL